MIKDWFRLTGKAFLWIGISLFFFLPLAAQNEKRVKILVTDANDGAPIVMCAIQKSGSTKAWFTDKNGECIIPINGKAEYRITFIGYQSKKITLSSDSPTKLHFKLRELNQMLTGIEVVENRIKSATTAKVSMVDKKEILNMQNKSMADLLSSLAGCRVLSTGSMIKKPIVEGMIGSRIAIVNNNTKLAGQHWGNDHAPELDIPTYADVSVIKGAESVKYGANAMGGVVLVNTDLNIQDDVPHLGFQSSYSSNGKMFGGNIFYEDQLPFISKSRFRVAYKYYRSGDYHTPKYNLTNTGSILHNANLDLAFNIAKWRWNAHASFYDAEIGIYRGSLIANQRDLMDRYLLQRPPESVIRPFSYKIDMPKQHVQHIIANADAAYSIFPNFILNLKYAFQRDYRREYGLRLGIYKGMPDFAFNLYTNTFFSGLKYLYGSNNFMSFGLNLSFANNITDRNTGAVPVIPNYVSRNVGLYYILSHYLSEKVKWESGIRYDHNYSNSAGFDLVGESYGGIKHYHSFSGNMGMMYTISPNQTLRMNAGLAWRAPEMNELYSHGVHHGDAVYQVGDPNLTTEKSFKMSSQYERTSRFLTLDANVYVNYIKDYIYDAPRFELVDGVRQPLSSLQNAGLFTKFFFNQTNAIFYGGDVSVLLGSKKSLSLLLRAEWIRARDVVANTFLPYIPSDRYEVKLNYKRDFYNYHLESSIGTSYVCKQSRFNVETELLPDTPPAYSLLDANLSLTKDIKEGRESIALFLNLNNLLNASYKEYTNRLHYFMHEKGRDITFGVRYNY